MSEARWTAEESVRSATWLFEKLYNQYSGKKWQDNVLGQCAKVMLLTIHPIDESCTLYDEAVKFYTLITKKEYQSKLQAQIRRDERKHSEYITHNEWEVAKKYFEYKCAYCGESNKLTYDHFVPLSKGGFLSAENTIPCCSKCNSSKNNKDFAVWYREQPFHSQDREKAIYKYLETV